MSRHFPSTKKKEAAGLKWLKQHLEKRLPGAFVEDATNKRVHNKNAVGDAVLHFNKKRFDIEIKVIGKGIPTNIRFTHQTVTKARGKDLIVALIYEFDEPRKTQVRFFRLGSAANAFQVEPHFILQKRDLSNPHVLQDLDGLSKMLSDDPVRLDLHRQFWKNENNHWRLTIEWEDQTASQT